MDKAKIEFAIQSAEALVDGLKEILKTENEETLKEAIAEAEGIKKTLEESL